MATAEVRSLGRYREFPLLRPVRAAGRVAPMHVAFCINLMALVPALLANRFSTQGLTVILIGLVKQQRAELTSTVCWIK